MKVTITCLYCNHSQSFSVVSREVLEAILCAVCGDKNIKVTEASKAKIDTYAGAPPFPDKKKPDNYKSDEDLEKIYGSWFSM